MSLHSELRQLSNLSQVYPPCLFRSWLNTLPRVPQAQDSRPGSLAPCPSCSLTLPVPWHSGPGSAPTSENRAWLWAQPRSPPLWPTGVGVGAEGAGDRG